MWVVYFFTIYAFVYTLSIIFNMLPDRRYFQYIPFDWHVKFWEIHSDVDDVRTDLFVHVSQVYLQNDSNAFFIGSIMIKKKKFIILTRTWLVAHLHYDNAGRHKRKLRIDRFRMTFFKRVRSLFQKVFFLFYLNHEIKIFNKMWLFFHRSTKGILLRLQLIYWGLDLAFKSWN